MKPSKSEQLWFWSVALSLAACGGGGSAVNAPPVQGINDPSMESSQPFTQTGAVELANNEISTLAELSGAPSGDLTSAEPVIDIFNTATLAELGALAVTTTTFFCNSPDPQNVDSGNGSVTITTDDQDPAGRSTGDSVTTTFNQCNQYGGVVNGTTSNTITSLTGDPFVTSPWIVDMTRTSDLTRTSAQGSSTTKSTASSKSESADGVVIMRTSTGQGSRSRTNTAGVTTDSMNQFSSKSTTDMNQQTQTSEFDMTSTEGTSTRTAKTNIPITGPINSAPTAGVIEIKETDSIAGVNRLVRVTMQADGTSLVEIDSNGDRTVDETFTSRWFGGIGFDGGFDGGFRGGFRGDSDSHSGGPGFAGGADGGNITPPISGQPPVGLPDGGLQPPIGGGPISPVPPINTNPGTTPGFGGRFGNGVGHARF